MSALHAPSLPHYPVASGGASRSARITVCLGPAVVALILSACASTAAPTTRVPESPRTGIVATTASAAASPGAATPSTTVPVAAASSIAAREAAFGTPVGLAFDAAGNLYVSSCDATQYDIRRIDPHGTMTIFAGNGAGYSGDGGPAISAQLFCPIGMAFGPDGAMYVADHGNNRIRRIDTAGIITTIAGSGATGVDMGSFSGDGGPAIEATLQEPWSVAFDSQGSLYVGDRDNNTVRKVNSHGVISTVIGTGASESSGDGKRATAAAVVEPGHFAFDAAGNLFVQDGTRVRRVDPHGIISTVFGNGKTGVPTDGMNALEAPLPELYGIAVDADGDLYLADGNTSVYRVDTNGIVTLFAGKR